MASVMTSVKFRTGNEQRNGVYIFLKFKVWLNPYDFNVSIVFTQNSFLFSNVKVSSCFVIRVFSIFSMSVIRACLIESCPGSEKCLSTGIFFCGINYMVT